MLACSRIITYPKFTCAKTKFITKQTVAISVRLEKLMCEFNVILNGKTVFKDVIYAKTESNNVIVKDVLGETKQFKNCRIIEIDVNSTRLVLTSSKT